MGVTKRDFQVVYMYFVIIHLGTEVSLKGILGGIYVDVILEQYSTDQSPPGLLGTYKRLDGIKVKAVNIELLHDIGSTVYIVLT